MLTRERINELFIIRIDHNRATIICLEMETCENCETSVSAWNVVAANACIKARCVKASINLSRILRYLY